MCKKLIVQVQVKQAFLTASPIPAKSPSLSPFPSPSLDLTITNPMFSEKVFSNLNAVLPTGLIRDQI